MQYQCGNYMGISMQNIEDSISEAHKVVMEMAFKAYPTLRFCNQPNVKFVENVRYGGLYNKTKNEIEYNLSIFKQDTIRCIKEIVPHEIAHFVCDRMGYGINHGKVWKAICKNLGGTGGAFFEAKGITIPSKRRVKKYKYVASCGTEVLLSSIRHKRLITGIVEKYTIQRTGGVIKKENFIEIV